MEGILSKSNLKDLFFSLLYSVLISVGAVLLFALIVKWFNISNGGILIGNTIIKIISLFFGIFFGYKNYQKGAIKGAVSGIIFVLLSNFVFSLYGGRGLFEGITIVSLLFGIISGTVSGIIAVNIRK